MRSEPCSVSRPCKLLHIFDELGSDLHHKLGAFVAVPYIAEEFVLTFLSDQASNVKQRFKLPLRLQIVLLVVADGKLHQHVGTQGRHQECGHEPGAPGGCSGCRCKGTASDVVTILYMCASVAGPGVAELHLHAGNREVHCGEGHSGIHQERVRPEI